MERSPDDLAAYLLGLELALARRDRTGADRELAELIADDAEEFGSSGRRWDRDGILRLLESRDEGAEILITHGSARELCPGVALVTYALGHTPRGGPAGRSLRSSIWVRDRDGWRLRFHQGTRVPAPGPDATA